MTAIDVEAEAEAKAEARVGTAQPPKRKAEAAAPNQPHAKRVPTGGRPAAAAISSFFGSRPSAQSALPVKSPAAPVAVPSLASFFGSKK